MTDNIKITLVGPAERLAKIEETLEEQALAITHLPVDSDKEQLEIICAVLPDLSNITDLQITVEAIPDQDWLALTARGETLAGSFIIKPYDGTQPGLHTIFVESEHAFGDGHHQTTRSCIEAMIGLHASGFTPTRIADIGCGTGILAIAASKLWPQAELSASDLDKTAVTATRQAIDWNMVAVQVHAGAGFDGHDGKYDLILMNLLAGIVTSLAASASVFLASGGRLIVSGLLNEQVASVLASFAPYSLGETKRIAQDGWTTLILGRQTDES